MKESKKNMRDPRDMQQRSWDEPSQSNKVKMVGTELSFNLNAEEDDVTIVPNKIFTNELGEELNCENIRKICVQCISGEIIVEACLDDDSDDFFVLSKLIAHEVINLDICAKKIRIKGTDPEAKGKLRGRS